MNEYPEVIVTQIDMYILSCPDCFHLITNPHSGNKRFGSEVFDYKTVDCATCDTKLAVPVMPTLVVT